MPTATPFTALGRGNGFPFCPTKVDVSTFDNVRELTLAEAMKIFWNLYSGTPTLSYSWTYTSPTPPNPESYSYSASLNSEVVLTPDKYPHDRVCYVSGISLNESESDGTEEDRGVFLRFQLSTFIRRLYNGVTTDEDNFIGYGAFPARYWTELYGSFVPFYIKMISYGTHFKSSDWDSVSPVTIGGIDLFKAEREIGTEPSGTDIVAGGTESDPNP